MNWRKWLFILLVLPLANLPERLRYVLSDFLAWVLRSVVKYRREVIDQNISIAFPEKSPQERIAIRNAFYTNFTDIALEQTWLLTASREDLLKKSKLTNPEVMERFAKMGKPVMMTAGHHNNYEMGAASIAMQLPVPLSVIYAPLQNPYFDERIRETRGKFGLVLWPRGQTAQRAQAWAEKYPSYSIGFAIDQSPHAGRRKYWMPFFGRMTAMSPGVEKYSRMYDAAVVFAYVIRERRGAYKLVMQEITSDANAEPPGAILAKANAMLEEVIRKDPPGWLWSHRRWKLNIEEHCLDGDTVSPIGVG